MAQIWQSGEYSRSRIKFFFVAFLFFSPFIWAEVIQSVINLSSLENVGMQACGGDMVTWLLIWRCSACLTRRLSSLEQIQRLLLYLLLLSLLITLLGSHCKIVIYVLVPGNLPWPVAPWLSVTCLVLTRSPVTVTMSRAWSCFPLHTYRDTLVFSIT